jgi:hypothetical protein
MPSNLGHKFVYRPYPDNDTISPMWEYVTGSNTWDECDVDQS